MTSTPDHPEAAVRLRQSHEPPDAVVRRGWRYHHIGIPTTVPRANETYLEQYGLWWTGRPWSSSGFATAAAEAASSIALRGKRLT